MVRVHLARVQVRAGVRAAEEDSAAVTVLARGQAVIVFAVNAVRECRTGHGFRAIQYSAPSAVPR